MLKKVVMITIYLVIGYQAKGFIFLDSDFVRGPASDKGVASVALDQKQPQVRPELKKMKNICTIHAGDVGKLRYKGKTYEQAFERVTDECFQRRTNLFVKMKKQHPTQDRQIQFVESCVNSVKCI